MDCFFSYHSVELLVDVEDTQARAPTVVLLIIKIAAVRHVLAEFVQLLLHIGNITLEPARCNL